MLGLRAGAIVSGRAHTTLILVIPLKRKMLQLQSSPEALPRLGDGGEGLLNLGSVAFFLPLCSDVCTCSSMTTCATKTS